MDNAANVLAPRVVHRFMADATAKMAIALILIGSDQFDLLIDGMADESGQGPRIGLPDDPADDIALALNRANLAVADIAAVFIRASSLALLAPLLIEMPLHCPPSLPMVWANRHSPGAALPVDTDGNQYRMADYHPRLARRLLPGIDFYVCSRASMELSLVKHTSFYLVAD
jgi:hypothetical protein